jgi:hypothetical protein
MSVRKLDGSAADGTFLQGHLPSGTTYDDIVRAFGPPTDIHEGCGDKTDVEWVLGFDDDDDDDETTIVATIYNWKNGQSYCGPTAPRYQDITDWNVGGFQPNVMDAVIPAIRRAIANRSQAT